MRRSLAGLSLGFVLALGLAAPAWGQATTAKKSQTPKAKAAKVDINTATAEELQELPGIGAVRAAAIIKARPFKTVADLKDVDGISTRVYDDLAPLVTASAPASTTRKSTAKETMKKAESKAKTAAKEVTSPGGKVDLNTATADELQELPGVGPSRAAAIVKARPFKSVADLKDVAGIPARVYDDLAPRVTVASVTSTVKTTAKETMKKAESKAKTAAREATTGGKVDLNTATVEELEELPGIGPARSAAIIKARPFKAVADLKNLEEVPARVYAEIEPRLTATPPAVVETKTAARKPMAKAESPRAKAAAKEAEEEEHPAQHSRKKAALAPDRKINLNTASVEELQELPGIGPVRSEAIVKGRPYETIEDVMKVDGIKEGVFGWIKDHISVK
ncbi:MAG TPA: helix-hairpin-helix domain-containing protein [Isosphaeraceae bacterium]|jgi:competence ComEA-like helix-hairpin-helix protein